MGRTLRAIQHVALPGASEHQTGLASICLESVDEGKRLVFGDTSEYKWGIKMLINMALYYVLRMVLNITGIDEPCISLCR